MMVNTKTHVNCFHMFFSSVFAGPVGGVRHQWVLLNATELYDG